MPLEQRLTERSILDVFIGAAERQPERTAITMLLSGAPDEQPRRVNYRDLPGGCTVLPICSRPWAAPGRAWPTCCRAWSRPM